MEEEEEQAEEAQENWPQDADEDHAAADEGAGRPAKRNR